MPSWYPFYVQTDNYKGSPLHGVFIHDQIKLLRKNNNICVFLPTMTKFMRLDKIKLKIVKKTEFTQVEFTFPKLVPKIHIGYYLSFNIICIIGFIIIRYFVLKQKIDLIHAHIIFLSGYSAAVLKKIFSIPFIITEHTNPFKINNKTEYKLAGKTLKRADALITVSEDLLKNIESYKFKINKKYIVGSVVDTDYFEMKTENQRNSGKHIFLNVSMIHKYKGLIYLLKAVKALLEKRVNNFEVWIGGDGPEKNDLISFVNQNNLTRYVIFLGLLQKKQVKEYFLKTDTFVFPSLNETFGLVVAEAMACGIPTIATINGGSETIITDETGILIESRNEFQLADAMNKRIRNEIIFDKDKIREHIIRNWGFESTIKKYKRIWKEIGLIN